MVDLGLRTMAIWVKLVFIDFEKCVHCSVSVADWLTLNCMRLSL